MSTCAPVAAYSTASTPAGAGREGRPPHPEIAGTPAVAPDHDPFTGEGGTSAAQPAAREVRGHRPSGRPASCRYLDDSVGNAYGSRK